MSPALAVVTQSDRFEELRRELLRMNLGAVCDAFRQAMEDEKMLQVEKLRLRARITLRVDLDEETKARRKLADLVGYYLKNKTLKPAHVLTDRCAATAWAVARFLEGR